MEKVIVHYVNKPIRNSFTPFVKKSHGMVCNENVIKSYNIVCPRVIICNVKLVRNVYYSKPYKSLNIMGSTECPEI